MLLAMRLTPIPQVDLVAVDSVAALLPRAELELLHMPLSKCQPCPQQPTYYSSKPAARVMLCSFQVDLVAVDSVAALLPRAELEGVIGDQQVASQARLMSYGLRKLAANAHKTNTTIMFINQLRHRVSVYEYKSPAIWSASTGLQVQVCKYRSASTSLQVQACKYKSGQSQVRSGTSLHADVHWAVGSCISGAVHVVCCPCW